MNKVKILFREDREIEGFKLEKGKIYYMHDTPEGFLASLVRKGCVIVDKGEALRDPRFDKKEEPVKKKAKKKTKKKKIIEVFKQKEE